MIMINKITKRHLIGFSFIICHLSFSIALTSCSEWDDHYEGAQTGTSLTLWQQLQQMGFVYSNVRLKNEVREHIRVEEEVDG